MYRSDFVGGKLMKLLCCIPITKESNEECNDRMTYRVCYLSSSYACFFYGISLSLRILLYSSKEIYIYFKCGFATIYLLTFLSLFALCATTKPQMCWDITGFRYFRCHNPELIAFIHKS